MDIEFTSNRDKNGAAVVASSGRRSRNRDWWSGKAFRVIPPGIRTEDFSKNPMLLWLHNAREPIGTTETFMENGKLMARPTFHRLTPMSNMVGDLWDNKFLNAVSVRINLDADDEKAIVETDEEIMLMTSELIELSIVTLPGDAGAVRQYLQTRQADAYPGTAVQSILESLDSNSEVNETMDQEKELIEEGAEPTAEAMEAAPNSEAAPFELDDESVQQLSAGLGIDTLIEQMAQVLEYVAQLEDAQLEQRVAELEGEPTIKSRVPARFTFTSANAGRQSQSPPDTIPAPRAPRRTTAASRQMARMARSK